MTSARGLVRCVLGAALLVAAALAGAQSNSGAPVVAPAAKVVARPAFVASSAELPASIVVLPAADAREIGAAKAANARAVRKALQIGVGRSLAGYAGVDASELSWREVRGGLAARWEVTSPDAVGLRVGLRVGDGARGIELRFAGSAEPDRVHGPFTGAQIDTAGETYWSPVLEGETAAIEVFVPREGGVSLSGLALTHVSHLFVGAADPAAISRAKAENDSGGCSPDLACKTAGNAALANVAKSVARMTFVSGAQTFLCTGTLLNPTGGSNAHYFYSAAHCLSTQAVANTLTTHWFFDRTGCGTGGTSSSYVQRTGGADLLYANVESDVLLVDLDSAPPSGAWRSGWDAAALAGNAPVAGIHHPSGDWKKVSQGNFAGVQNDLGGSFPSGSFSVIQWTEGVTEKGSSGSGIFTAVGAPATEYKLRGGLWGGSSGCGLPPEQLYDFYSRLDLAYPSLRQWLDPVQPGVSLLVSKGGAGSGTVTSAPAAIDCGLACTASFPAASTVALAAVASAGSRFSGWSGACTGVGACQVAMDAPRFVTATFAPSGTARVLDISVASVDFGLQSMGLASMPVPIAITNVGSATVTFGTFAATTGFSQSTTCGPTLAPGASCTVNAVAAPPVQAGAIDFSASTTGTLSIPHNAAGAVDIALSVMAQKSLAPHYYRAILRRSPDAGGAAFWTGEAQRMHSLGANLNEAWFALAMGFFGSAEYLAFDRSDADFVTDLYNTFFGRAPDAPGLAYWNQQLFNGLPRGVALSAFMFSPEFAAITQGLYGNTAARPEVDTVVDFYRGLLGRLPDSGGFTYWLQRFRTAQCRGAAAVLAEVDAISSAFATGAEYQARARNNPQFVGDLYNAFLRRGGDLTGVQFWINQLATLVKSREDERREFLQSAEFAARVSAIVAAPCLP